eukprot:TRINITY_DN4435_c0_g2_i1.p2 TRINITY_DN4435_c0_g2~~TRINITY_DN4435_c0_g2_i1.p2  ORF type:complete len:156 (+),score=41.46 TRINITY_DN4435_c0_g2_i1:72-470(+)
MCIRDRFIVHADNLNKDEIPEKDIVGFTNLSGVVLEGGLRNLILKEVNKNKFLLIGFAYSTIMVFEIMLTNENKIVISQIKALNDPISLFYSEYVNSMMFLAPSEKEDVLVLGIIDERGGCIWMLKIDLNVD